MIAQLTVVETTNFREAYAKRIRQLMVDWTNNSLDLGAELAKAENTFPINPKRPHERPGFMTWAKKETGLSKAPIVSLLQIHKKFGGRDRHPRLAHHVMKILARDVVPEEARKEAIDRVAKGEKINEAKAKEIAAKHRLPSAKEANAQAKEEKRPVLARDGYIYFGTDPEKAKEGADRRKMVYDVRDALTTLGSIQLTARQFLAYAFPHQLWTPEEAPIIKKALRWLVSLDDAWDSRE